MPKHSELQRPRPRFYEDAAHPWHIELVPKTWDAPPGLHPAWRCGVFVVHGIGMQTPAEIGAALRSGFDDALVAILEEHASRVPHHDLPPPYVQDGWWANYGDVEKTFPKDWSLFEEEQKDFFRELWKQRTGNALATVLWFFKQQLRLLRLRTLWVMGPLTYILYIILQIVSGTILLALFILRRNVVNGFLADIRLYADPRGVTERAIVQRIDARVADQFLQMIGLDREFKRLSDKDCIKASGQSLRFERVVWVAHSLGTVISYNVLSDLFYRASEIDKSGDPEQKGGVEIFRNALRRFVTLGSPLDKFAFLFNDAIRPWPKIPRWQLLNGGDHINGREHTEWWTNYYHILDPVSGALSHPDIKGGKQQADPVNIHLSGRWKVPGVAHIAYWRDIDVLRFILGRTYGAEYLPDRDPPRQMLWKILLYKMIGFIVWACIILGSAYGILVYAIPFLMRKFMAFVTG